MPTRIAIDQDGNEVEFGLAVNAAGDEKWIPTGRNLTELNNEQGAEVLAPKVLYEPKIQPLIPVGEPAPGMTNRTIDFKNRQIEKENENERLKADAINSGGPAYQPNIRPMVSSQGVSPYGTTQSAIRNINKRIEAQNAYERSLVGDKYGQALKKSAEEMSGWDAASAGLLRTADKFAAGTADIVDFALHKTGSDPARERMVERFTRQAEKDRKYRHISSANPLSSIGGESLLYLLTGIGTKPIIDMAEKGIVKLGGMASTNLNRALRKIDKPISKSTEGMGKELSDLLEPARVRFRHKEKRDKADSDVYTTPIHLARLAGTGVLEGGAHYDLSALEGAGMSMLGGALGSVSPIRGAERIANNNSTFVNKLLDKFSGQGVYITPGMRTNNNRILREEAAMRSHPNYSNYMAAIDKANTSKITELTSKAIGLPDVKLPELTPGALKGHLDDMSSTYKELEATTFGRFEKSDFDNLIKFIDENRNAFSPRARNNAREAWDILSKMRSMNKKSFDSSGNYVDTKYSGTDYQKLRSDLKALSKDSYENNSQLYNVANSTLKTLDNSMKTALGNRGPKVLKQWKDTHEKYAMTKLLIESGLTPHGKVDLDSLSSTLMSRPEAQRTLTSQGGRIRDLQDLIKYNAIAKDAPQSNLSSGGLIQGSDKPSTRLSRFGVPTSTDLAMNPMRRLFTDKYMEGWPLTRGLGVGTGRQFNRAISMPGGPLEVIDRAIESGLENVGLEDVSLKDLGANLLGIDSKKKDKDDFEEFFERLIEARK